MIGRPFFDKVAEFELTVDAGDDLHTGQRGNFLAFQLSVATRNDDRSVGITAVERADCLTTFFVCKVSDRAGVYNDEVRNFSGSYATHSFFGKHARDGRSLGKIQFASESVEQSCAIIEC